MARGGNTTEPVNAIGQIWQAKLYHHLTDQLGLNVIHYRVSAVAGTGSDADKLLIAVSQAFHVRIKDLMVVTATFDGLRLQRIRPVVAAADCFSTDDAGPGTVNGDALPRQSSGLISKRTAISGRHGRGRYYVPFPSEDDNDSSPVPVPAYVVRLALLATVIATPLTIGAGANTATLTPVVYDRATGIGVNIVSCTAANRWATQRRRGSFGAVNPVGP